MVAIRNVLIHNYARINLRRTWEFIAVSAPAIVGALAPLVPGEAPGE